MVLKPLVLTIFFIFLPLKLAFGADSNYCTSRSSQTRGIQAISHKSCEGQRDSAQCHMGYNAKLEMQTTVLNNTMEDTISTVHKTQATYRSAIEKCRGMIPFSLALGFVGDSYQYNLKRQVQNNCGD